MASIKVRGIVIKQSAFGEANRILTIFTKEYGIIRAAAYGAKSIRSKNTAATQFLAYSDFILYKSDKELMNIQSAEVVESFFSVQEDVVKLSLCVYMCDLVYALLNTNSPDNNILNLILNSVYALANRDILPETVRTVFELKVMAYGGYMPNINCCCACGDVEKIAAFSAECGGIICSDCSKTEDIPINSGVYHALSYIIKSEPKKMFSFNASDEVMNTLSKISEKYVSLYCEKNFSSLTYYKKMLI